MKKILLGLAACMLACGASLAERADALKKISVVADSGVANMISQNGVAEGNVVLTRGTLLMKAGRMNLTEDPEGYKSAILVAAPGTLATFRQKRDGGADLWVEGEAERIEYSDKTDIVKLSGRAKVTSLDGAKITNRAEGPFLSYDSRKEELAALNTPSGQSKVGGGRVEFTFDNKPHPPAPAPAPAGKK
jgi:lipopolysaccharide export system protein LptA